MRVHVKKNQTARDVPLDNTTNGFVAEEVQSALEEIDFRQERLEPTGFVNTRFDSTFTFSETTRVFTISPVSTSYEYLIRGIKYIKTGTDTVTIGDVGGLWFIYFSGTTLTASQTVWSFTEAVAFVATIYWSSNLQKATLINEERHGLVMSWATHRYLHFTRGLELQIDKFEATNFILRGGGNLDAHAQIAYTDLGLVFDEDLDFTPINSASPTLPYEQIIHPILWAPILYRTGATGLWEKRDATQFPVLWTAGQRISYNQWTGSTWQLTQASEDYFVTMFTAITEDPRHPFIVFAGQMQHPTVVEAAAEEWKNILEDIPTAEIHPLSKLIFKTSSTYTNQPKAELYSVLDIGDLNIDNDRYTVEVGYNGNAGTGKYMDRSTGTASNVDPITFPEASFIRYITIQASANSTGTVGVFNITNLVTPVITLSLSASRYVKGAFSQYFNADEQITLRITSGAISKPLVTLWIQTQLG